MVEYPPLVCDIAYALCKPQCDEKNVSDEDFGRAMGGDVLEKVLDLILEETVDFFPQGRRTVLKRMLEKSQTFAEKARALTTARLEAGELDAAIDAALEPELKKLEGQEKAPLTTGTGTASTLAGIVGIDPGPRTLGELMAMAKGRQRAEWERTSLLAAIARNSYPLGGKRKKPFQPWEFNPFTKGRRRPWTNRRSRSAWSA